MMAAKCGPNCGPCAELALSRNGKTRALQGFESLPRHHVVTVQMSRSRSDQTACVALCRALSGPNGVRNGVRASGQTAPRTLLPEPRVALLVASIA